MILKRLQVKTPQVGLLTNSYIICDEETKEAMVIDPGGEPEKIAEVLQVNIKDLFYSPYEIDTLKEEMYRRIEEYGIGSKEVMEVSQIIDLLINIKLKKE